MEDNIHNPLIFRSTDKDDYDVYRTINTLSEMMMDRKYPEFSKGIEKISFEQFKEKYIDDEGNINYEEIESLFYMSKIKVKWIVDAKPGVGHIKKCYNELKSEGKMRIIIITKYKFTTQANSALEEMRKIGYIFEIFLQEELVINITHHEKVPKHILLTNEEKANILKIYNVSINKLPILKETDPVSRYYSFKRGDVVKIVRDKDGKKHITYRGVI